MKFFSIRAPWGYRPETPAQIAQRLRSLISLLRPIAAPFERWYQVVAEDSVREFTGAATWLDDVIAAHVCKGDLGEPISSNGYLFVTCNRPTGSPPRADDIFIDTQAGGNSLNSISMFPSSELDLDASLLDFFVMKKAILAISRSFEPTYCEAGPFSLWQDMKLSDYKHGPVITPCWMIHLSPLIAQRVAPPADVISERYADGSLFMSATSEPFDDGNPMHVDAAHRLFAVLDTLQEKKPPEQWRR